MEYAIDRKAIAEALGYGFWEPANQICSSTKLGYNADYQGHPYDPNKARELLAQAGYPNGFKTKIIMAPHFGDRDAMVAVQHYLRKVGIDAELEIPEKGRYYELNFKGWHNALFYVVIGQDPNYATSLNRQLISTAKWYKSMLRPAGFDELAKQALTARDPEAIKMFCQKAVRLGSEEVMFVPLWTVPVITIMDKTVRDTYFCHWTHTLWQPADAWLSR